MFRPIVRTIVIAISVLASSWAIPISANAGARTNERVRTAGEWTEGPDRRAVYLTFEGRTNNANLLSMLAQLHVADAKATFFMPGEWLERNALVAKVLLLAGHSFGNSGMDGRRFTQMSDTTLRRAIIDAEDILEEIGADPQPYLRPPDGVRDSRVLEVASQIGYRSLRWTYRAGSGDKRSVVDDVMRNVDSGSILSLDPGRESHRKALPVILQRLDRKGLALKDAGPVKNASVERWVRIEPGDTGPDVRRLQEALNRRTYPAGTEDGNYGESTLQAVLAFEKVHGIERDGIVTPEEMTELMSSGTPEAPSRDAVDFIDIDLTRQVLFEVRGGEIVNTIPVSTANGEQYVSDGETRTAVTPRGTFEILWKIPGRRVSDLGELWYPAYFHSAGYAIHGSTSVPAYPASHGCVRIPMYLAQDFFDRVRKGTPVYVHD